MKISKKWFVLVLFIPVIIYIMQPSPSVKSKPYNALLKTMLKHSVEEVSVREIVESKAPPILLDAREKVEYDISHMPEAIYIGYDDFDIKKLNDFSKEENLVVYCSMGLRSEKIAEKIKEAGYTNVKNLFGGIFEWKNQGQPVFLDNTETDDVHAFSKFWGVWLKNGNKKY